MNLMLFTRLGAHCRIHATPVSSSMTISSSYPVIYVPILICPPTITDHICLEEPIHVGNELDFRWSSSYLCAFLDLSQCNQFLDDRFHMLFLIILEHGDCNLHFTFIDEFFVFSLLSLFHLVLSKMTESFGVDGRS